MTVRLRVLSLGAGVQSTTLALMAAHGEIGPPPDVAIFADTGWEPRHVHEHLGWLRSGNVLPFPVLIVQHGNLHADLLRRATAKSGRFVTIPAFLKYQDGSTGMGRRQCTAHYKIEPVRAPDEFANAVEVDRLLRPMITGPRSPGLRGEQFLHRSRVPLDRVDFHSDAKAEDLTLHECQGGCFL